MLEILRSKTNHVVVYFILGAIIVTFILGFGPASNKVGCGGSKDVLATIDGNNIEVSDWRFGLYFAGRLFRDQQGGAIELRRFAMDKLIERELLQDLANKNGIVFTQSDAEDMVMSNRVIIFGIEMKLSDLGAFPVDPKTNKPYAFNYQLFERFVRSMGYPTVDLFLDQLVKEMEAKAYKDAYVYGSASSHKANWIDYQNDNITFSYKSARFIPDSFLDKVTLPAGKVDGFLKIDKMKKSAEAEFKRNKALYTKGEMMRKAQLLTVKIKNEGALATFAADIEKQATKDLASLEKALPQYKKVFDWLKTQKKEITLETVAKAAKDMGEKGELKSVDFFKKGDSKLDATVTKMIFESKVGKDAYGPLFVKEGALFVFVEAEKASTLSDEVGLRKAAEKLLKLEQAEKKCEETAKAVLAKLKKGIKPEAIKELPEMLTEGPINPIADNGQKMDRKLAKDIWNLGEAGKVLDRVVTIGKGAMKTYNIYILHERNLPSREDFMEIQKNRQNDRVDARSIQSLSINVADLCKRYSKSLRFSRDFISMLNYKRPPNTPPEKLKTMPAENYVPCQYLSNQ